LSDRPPADGPGVYHQNTREIRFIQRGRPKARAQTQDEVGNRQTGYSFSQSALNLVSNLSPANRGFKAHIKQTVSMEGRRVGISRQGAAD